MLISPVFDTPSDPFPQIKTVLSTLPGNSKSLHGCGSTWFAGHHVHVGLPREKWPPSLRLATLQHLAYILLLYEPIISNLHPLHRRPYADPEAPQYIDLEPNHKTLDDGYQDDPQRYSSNRDEWGDKTTYPPPEIISLRRTRGGIWAEDQTISDLAEFITSTKDSS